MGSEGKGEGEMMVMKLANEEQRREVLRNRNRLRGRSEDLAFPPVLTGHGGKGK